ncbi:ribonuclease E/G [Anaerosphaera multitolerans]|uniref:S1 motif domain-containing protein n=1 Tax=Anaerosphaera multitolerans TaxID=2487351 RepID=A0A437S802_9FIRM|nr:ribonuclease E/G [Anaerosphaera multitolerans]RVU54967.1 hypothetical protein EF514_05115 [Anaerosphaera multitolerans]
MTIFYIDDFLKVAIKYEDDIKRIIDFDDSNLYSIYRGRVHKISKSMNCAFVDIGLDKYGYLELNDSIGDIKETDEILVQVKKIPEGDKAVKLTMEISFSGQQIVFFPQRKFLKFSRKLEESERKLLLKIAQENKMEGVLFRSGAKSFLGSDLVEEYINLKTNAEAVLREINLRPTPKLLYTKDKLSEFLNANYREGDKVIINSPKLYSLYSEKYNTVYKQGFKISYNPILFNKYKSLFQKKIELENGTNIIIERTEALCVIDVNSASYKGNLDFEDGILQVNLRAAKEVAKQIILRNISGIIVVDFISMKKEEHKRKLLSALKTYFNEDYSQTKVFGFTNLGLVEISRKNSGKELKKKIGD